MNDDWMQRFLAVIEEHVGSEKEILDAYEAAHERVSHRTVRYLLATIIADERKDHELLRELRDRVTTAVEGRRVRQPIDADERASLRELTDQMLSVEHHDLEEVEHLGQDLQRVRGQGPWARTKDLLRTLRTDHLGEQDRVSLGQVEAELDTIDDTVLWSLVLRIIELDTRKRIEILDAIHDVVSVDQLSGLELGPVDV